MSDFDETDMNPRKQLTDERFAALEQIGELFELLGEEAANKRTRP